MLRAANGGVFGADLSGALERNHEGFDFLERVSSKNPDPERTLPARNVDRSRWPCLAEDARMAPRPLASSCARLVVTSVCL